MNDVPGTPSHTLELLDENLRANDLLQVGLTQDLRLPASNTQQISSLAYPDLFTTVGIKSQQMMMKMDMIASHSDYRMSPG
jgi:hypothetical protein